MTDMIGAKTAMLEYQTKYLYLGMAKAMPNITFNRIPPTYKRKNKVLLESGSFLS